MFDYVFDIVDITDECINIFAEVVDDTMYFAEEIIITFPYDESNESMVITDQCPQTYTERINDTMLIGDGSTMPSYFRDDCIDFIEYVEEYRAFSSERIEEFMVITDGFSQIIRMTFEDEMTISDEVFDALAKRITESMTIVSSTTDHATFRTRINDGTGRIRDGTKHTIKQQVTDDSTITDGITDRQFHALSDTIIVSDTAHQFNNLTDLISDRPMRVVDTVRQSRTVAEQVVEQLIIIDSTSDATLERITDTMTVSDDTQQSQSLLQHIIDRPMRVTDTVRQGRIVTTTVTDTLVITDAVRDIPIDYITDTITVSDDTRHSQSLLQRIVDRPMRIVDTVRQGRGEYITDEIVITDDTQHRALFNVFILDGATIDDDTTDHKLSVSTVVDVVIIEDELTVSVSRLTEFVNDNMTITDSTTEDTTPETVGHWWTADARTWGMSRYEMPVDAHSLTVIDGRLYAIGADGLYELSDAVEPIEVSVVTGRIDAAVKVPTHPTTGYFSFNSDNATLTVNDVSYDVVTTNDYEPRRVKIGRGFRQRYYKFELNFNTVETDLIDFDILFVDSKRRV